MLACIALFLIVVARTEASVCTSARGVWQESGCCDGAEGATQQSCPDPERGVDVFVDEILATGRVHSRQQSVSVPLGRYYDDTEVDVNGTVFCPFSFGSTLPHPPPLYAPLCRDVRAFRTYVRCPTSTWTGSVARARPYAAKDALLPLPGHSRVPFPASASFLRATSEAQAFEMFELYALSQLRDCHVERLSTDCQAECDRTLSALSTFPGREATSCSDLYRLSTVPFASSGPYVSQLLLRSYKDGAQQVDRRFPSTATDQTLSTRQGYLEAEEGTTLTRSNPSLPDLVYPHDCRSLGTMVDGEPAYKHYLSAALLLMQTLGSSSFSLSTEDVLTSLHGGFDDVLVSVAEVTRNALAESYRAKYLQSMKMRPASMASLIDVKNRSSHLSPSDVGAVAQIWEHAFGRAERKSYLDEMARRRGDGGREASYLLANHYRTSRHPSYTHGHGTVAAAAVTVLKGLIRTATSSDMALVPWQLPLLVPSQDGTALEDAPASLASGSTIADELDKLAHNVAIGRNCAGQHFRTEAEVSLSYGQDVGVRFLQTKACAAFASEQTVTPPPVMIVPLFNRTCVAIRGCDPLVSAPCISDPAPSTTPSPPPPFPSTPIVTPVRLLSSVMDGSPETFLRLTPSPTLTANLPSPPVSVDQIGFVQRQMAFGDSTTKRATVMLKGPSGMRSLVVCYGVPTESGEGGTALTDFEDDAYGRTPRPSAVNVSVCGPQCDGSSAPACPSPFLVSEIEYKVISVYPFLPDEPAPRQYGGRGYASGKYGTTKYTSPSPSTDAFYGSGTYDVGLVEMRLSSAGVPVAPGAVSASDNSGNPLDASDDERAANPLLNPFRDASCDGGLLSGTRPACTSESMFVDVPSGPPGATWPCNETDQEPRDCSNYAVAKAWSFPGWCMRDPACTWNAWDLLPNATADLFSELLVKPTVEYEWSSAAPVTLRSVGLRMRHMAYRDASVRRATVCLNDGEVCLDAHFSYEDGTAVLTTPDTDSYGRGGLAGESVVDFGMEREVRRLRVRVEEIMQYSPPSSLLEHEDAEKRKWGVTPMEETYPVFYYYAHVTGGTWNVGFTHVSMYDGAGSLVPRQIAEAASATSNGASSFQLGGRDIFSPRNPILNAYLTEEDTHILPLVPVPTCWSWPGHATIRRKDASVKNYLPPHPPSLPPYTPSPPPSPILPPYHPEAPEATGEPIY